MEASRIGKNLCRFVRHRTAQRVGSVSVSAIGNNGFFIFSVISLSHLSQNKWLLLLLPSQYRREYFLFLIKTNRERLFFFQQLMPYSSFSSSFEHISKKGMLIANTLSQLLLLSSPYLSKKICCRFQKETINSF